MASDSQRIVESPKAGRLVLRYSIQHLSLRSVVLSVRIASLRHPSLRGLGQFTRVQGLQAEPRYCADHYVQHALWVDLQWCKSTNRIDSRHLSAGSQRKRGCQPSAVPTRALDRSLRVRDHHFNSTQPVASVSRCFVSPPGKHRIHLTLKPATRFCVSTEPTRFHLQINSPPPALSATPTRGDPPGEDPDSGNSSPASFESDRSLHMRAASQPLLRSSFTAAAVSA